VRRLILVRHGESIWNAEQRVQGQSCRGLSTLGRAQARVTAAALSAAYPQAVLVTSDLQRTVQTVAPLEHELATRADQDERLRERHFGTWEGRLRTEIADDEPERWARFRAGEDLLEEVGGESSVTLTARVLPVLRELLDGLDDDGVMIAVTHGGPIWYGLHGLFELPRPSLGGVGNTSVTELIAWDGPVEGIGSDGAVALDRYNELAHLPVELRTAWQPARARTAS
jgi:glucosyl-3-phosphoglycerate phosphatase